jgi:eukaryotic-like serine/threonine-protein kinase
VLQNLGRLLVQYHFPDEAEQIRLLMQPAPPIEPGAPEQPGMVEEAASYAVLGVGIDALGAAVARHWGLGEEMQSMMRRLPPGKAVRTPDGDAALLRIVASAANEAVDTMSQLPAPRVGPALAQIAQRHARVLTLTVREFGEALQGARAALQSGSVADSMKARGSDNAATPAGAAA